jgi:hypothetical protein
MAGVYSGLFMYKSEAMYLLQGLNFAQHPPPTVAATPAPACFDQKVADWNEITKSAADSVVFDPKPHLKWVEVMQRLNTKKSDPVPPLWPLSTGTSSAAAAGTTHAPARIPSLESNLGHQ